MSRLISLLLICVNFTLASVAQTDIILSPENTSVNIEPYNVKWTQTVIESNGTKRKGINTITDITKITSDTIIRVLKWKDTSNNTYIKTDVLKKLTLKPISIDVRWNPEHVEHTDIFNKNYASIRLNNSTSKSEQYVGELDDDAFTWSSDGFALLCLLDKNITGDFTIKVINNLPEKPKAEKKHFRIVGEETLNLEKFGIIQTKKIETLKNNKITTTYWLSNLKPYIVKVKFLQDSGQTTIWQIEDFK